MDWLTKYAEIPDRERIHRIAEILAVGIERHARQNRLAPAAATAHEQPSAAKPLSVTALVTDSIGRQILAYLERTGAATPRDFQQALGLSPMTVTRRLARLRSAGLVAVEGQTRSARYRIRTDFAAN
ncbi:MAG: winged helix-turn-helix transcriptional regulator [Acidimicrobiia bacterium]